MEIAGADRGSRRCQALQRLRQHQTQPIHLMKREQGQRNDPCKEPGHQGNRRLEPGRIHRIGKRRDAFDHLVPARFELLKRLPLHHHRLLFRRCIARRRGVCPLPAPDRDGLSPPGNGLPVSLYGPSRFPAGGPSRGQPALHGDQLLLHRLRAGRRRRDSFAQDTSVKLVQGHRDFAAQSSPGLGIQSQVRDQRHRERHQRDAVEREHQEQQAEPKTDAARPRLPCS